MKQISEQKTQIISEGNNERSQILLGEGTFASVYKLKEKGKNYAVKKIPKVLINRQGRFKQLTRQIEIMRKVNHENIVKFYDFQDDDKKDYIIKMEFCQGKNLRNYLLSDEYAKLSKTKAKYYATRICLDYIHALGEVRSKMVTNRDIKPDNIIILLDQKTGKIQAKMIDFGEATFNIQEAMSQVGTRGYMAPEIYFALGNYSESCDMWSLGQTIYQIFQGVQPDSRLRQYLGSPFEERFKPVSLKDYQYYYEHLIYSGVMLTKSKTPGPFRQIIRGLLNIDGEQRMTFSQMLEILQKRFSQIQQCLQSQQQILYERNRIMETKIKQKQTLHYKNIIKQNLNKIENMCTLYKKIVQKLPLSPASTNSKPSFDQKLLKTKEKDICKLIVFFVREISTCMNEIVGIMDLEFQCFFQEILMGIITKDEFQEMWKLADRFADMLGNVGSYSFQDIPQSIIDFMKRHFGNQSTTSLELIKRIIQN